MACEHDIAPGLGSYFRKPLFWAVGKQKLFVVERTAVEQAYALVVYMEYPFFFHVKQIRSVFRGQAPCRSGVHNPFFFFPRLVKGFSPEKLDNLVVRIPSNGDHLVVSKPVQGLVGERSIHCAVTSIADKVKAIWRMLLDDLV